MKILQASLYWLAWDVISWNAVDALKPAMIY